ncbi:MAG: beta-lactamase family protein [Myxococcales bacterium]|nr:beta-lactamase family protein [Myxococcales bacterium]
MMVFKWLSWVLLVAGCGTIQEFGEVDGSPAARPEAPPPLDRAFDAKIEAIRQRHGVAAISIGVLRGGKLAQAGGAGQADPAAGIAARADTLYSLASVSKIVVGVAIARAMELGYDLDLDRDVNTWLRWSRPLRHPRHPGTPITLRHLVRHQAGIASDGPADIDDYPRPDPRQSLDAFLQGLLAQSAYWEDFAPGQGEEYSNLGASLAALVVQKAVGQPFEVFCNREIFGPLGMTDSRWFYRELGSSQRGRLAMPLDEDGEPYGHYGFEDWPSGQLRSTVADMAKLLEALIGDGSRGGVRLLSAARVRQFQEVPLFIEADAPSFEHSGGEAGVNTFVRYNESGNGLILLTNQDMDDDVFEAVITEAEALAR